MIQNTAHNLAIKKDLLTNKVKKNLYVNLNQILIKQGLLTCIADFCFAK